MSWIIHLEMAILLLSGLVHSYPRPHTELTTKDRSLPLAPHVLNLKATRGHHHHSKLMPRQTSLIDSFYQRYFLAPVSLGGQTVDLMIDTGSSNTWAVTEGYACEKGYECDFGKPITIDGAFEKVPGETFYTGYVDGSGGSGILANTSVTIAGVTIPDQSVGLVDSLANPGDGTMSGMVGLAYPRGTTAAAGSKTLQYSSLMNTIFQEGLADPLFSIAISRDASNKGYGGYLAIGGIPDTSHPEINVSSDWSSADIQPNPLMDSGSEFTNYVIEVDSIQWSDSRGSSSPMFDLDSESFLYLVDTGTTFTFVPKADAAAVNALFQPPARLDADGYYEVQCDATPAQLNLTVGDQLLLINPDDLILERAAGDNRCYSGVQPIMPDYPIGILGDTVLRSLLAVFDWGEKKVHLASRPFYDS